MISKEFKTSINKNNCSLKYSNTILSRDSVYVVCFSVSDDLICELKNDNIGWKTGINFLKQCYLIPHQEYIEGIDEIIRSVNAGECFYIVRAVNNITSDFKLLICNPNENTLFFMYYTT